MTGIPKEVLIDGIKFNVRSVESTSSQNFVFLSLRLYAPKARIENAIKEAETQSEFVRGLSKPAKRKFKLDD